MHTNKMKCSHMMFQNLARVKSWITFLTVVARPIRDCCWALIGGEKIIPLGGKEIKNRIGQKTFTFAGGGGG